MWVCVCDWVAVRQCVCICVSLHPAYKCFVIIVNQLCTCVRTFLPCFWWQSRTSRHRTDWTHARRRQFSVALRTQSSHRFFLSQHWHCGVDRVVTNTHVCVVNCPHMICFVQLCGAKSIHHARFIIAWRKTHTRCPFMLDGAMRAHTRIFCPVTQSCTLFNRSQVCVRAIRAVTATVEHLCSLICALRLATCACVHTRN
jgi:hypothetical protein